MEPIGGGRNSRVFRLEDQSDKRYLLKLYFHEVDDPRNRLLTEFEFLKFLWEKGLRCIPEPIQKVESKGFAIYQFIEGEKIDGERVTDGDLETVVAFLTHLKKLKDDPAIRDFQRASEAFFSVAEVVENVHWRFQRLIYLKEGQEEEYRHLKIFLEQELKPFFDDYLKWCLEKLDLAKLSFTEEIPWEERTLNPSDFGFHNAIRQRNGQMIFLDFEYVGWDDPAKMVCDFLLHPAMDLSLKQKQFFLDRIFSTFRNYKTLIPRTTILYPLFALKWCLIFLNEFIPRELSRREFAAYWKGPVDKKPLLKKQLQKAKKMLLQIKGTYQKFPYVLPR